MKKKNTIGKTGRPKKEDNIKNVFRTVRFAQEEDEQLGVKVSQYGGSRSDFIRKAALGVKIVSVPDPETIKLLQEYRTNLRNIGINLNAIAHRANTKEIEFDYSDLQESKKECESFLLIVKKIQSKMMQ